MLLACVSAWRQRFLWGMVVGPRKHSAVVFAMKSKRRNKQCGSFGLHYHVIIWLSGRGYKGPGTYCRFMFKFAFLYGKWRVCPKLEARRGIVYAQACTSSHAAKNSLCLPPKLPWVRSRGQTAQPVLLCTCVGADQLSLMPMFARLLRENGLGWQRSICANTMYSNDGLWY